MNLKPSAKFRNYHFKMLQILGTNEINLSKFSIKIVNNGGERNSSKLNCKINNN